MERRIFVKNWLGGLISMRKGRLSKHVHGGLSKCSICYPSPERKCTVVSRYYDTAEIRKKYHNIQTIELSSTNF